MSQSVYICRCVPIRSWLCLSYAVMYICFCVYFSFLCVHTFSCLWEGGKRPCEPSSTEGKVEQWSTREWEGAWVISAPSAQAQRWGRIKVCECIRVCLPGIALFNYFIPVLIYPGASFLVGSPICIYIRACGVCVPVCACQGIDLWSGPLASSGICALSRHDSLHVPSQKLTTHQQ